MACTVNHPHGDCPDVMHKYQALESERDTLKARVAVNCNAQGGEKEMSECICPNHQQFNKHVCQCSIERDTSRANVIDLEIMCGTLQSRVAELEKLADEMAEAVQATDIYFKALCEQWAANDGRVVSDVGIVIAGSAEIERLCEIAGQKTVEAFAAFRAAQVREEGK